MVTEPAVQAALEKVRHIIATETGVRLERIHAESRLVEDLRIDGDDLVELVDQLFSQLAIDPGTFSYADYISAEGFSPQSALHPRRWFGAQAKTQTALRQPMTVLMWARGAVSGRWGENVA